MTKPLSPKLCRSVAEASDFLRLLANPNRLSLLCFLMEAEEASVATLALELGIRQPTLSQQLGELRDAGLVAARRQGKSILYRVANGRAAGLIHALRDMFSGLDDVTGRRAAALDLMMFD